LLVELAPPGSASRVEDDAVEGSTEEPSVGRFAQPPGAQATLRGEPRLLDGVIRQRRIANDPVGEARQPFHVGEEFLGIHR
jgi:hypothetical protein